MKHLITDQIMIALAGLAFSFSIFIAVTARLALAPVSMLSTSRPSSEAYGKYRMCEK